MIFTLTAKKSFLNNWWHKFTSTVRQLLGLDCSITKQTTNYSFGEVYLFIHFLNSTATETTYLTKMELI